MNLLNVCCGSIPIPFGPDLIPAWDSRVGVGLDGRTKPQMIQLSSTSAFCVNLQTTLVMFTVIAKKKHVGPESTIWRPYSSSSQELHQGLVHNLRYNSGPFATRSELTSLLEKELVPLIDPKSPLESGLKTSFRHKAKYILLQRWRQFKYEMPPQTSEVPRHPADRSYNKDIVWATLIVNDTLSSLPTSTGAERSPGV